MYEHSAGWNLKDQNYGSDWNSVYLEVNDKLEITKFWVLADESIQYELGNLSALIDPDIRITNIEEFKLNLKDLSKIKGQKFIY